MAKKKTKKEEARVALMVDDIERMLGSEPCSLDDLSERLNVEVDQAHHIAAGTIEMVLDELVSAGRAKVEGDGAKRVWRAAFDPNPERREAVLRQWLSDSKHNPYPEVVEGWLLEEVAAEVRQLQVQGHLQDDNLTPEAHDAILSMGIPAWSRASLDLPVVEPVAGAPAPAENAYLVQVQTEQLVQLRADLAAVRAQVDRARAWLDEHDLDAHEILGVQAPKAKTTRKEFDWTQTRQINDSEISVIFREVLALDARADAIKLEAAAAKDRYKGLLQAVLSEIASLKMAAGSHSRVVSCRAYREYDWAAQVERIYAVEDGRLLEERPIPHGTQREIQHELDEPASAVASEPDVDVEPGSDIEQAEAKAVDADDDEPFDDDGQGPFADPRSGDETAHIRAEMAS